MSKPRPEDGAETHKDPWVQWWMPVLAVIAPAVSAAWKGATADSGALKEALLGFAWPGLPLYFGLLIIFIAAYKIELE
jgi:hypothetical protein